MARYDDAFVDRFGAIVGDRFPTPLPARRCKPLPPVLWCKPIAVQA
jgi:hypothetical protein